MVQINWKKLSSLVPENLSEQEKDELYENLVLFKPEPKTESKNLLTLFNITQHVLKYKGDQVESLVVEFDDLAARQGEDEARRHEALLEEIEKLRAQLARYRSSSDKDFSGLSTDVEELQQELLRHELLNEELAAELKANERELLEEKREMEKLAAQVVTLEREKDDLKRELTALQEETAEKQEQILRQESPELSVEKQKEMTEMIRQKNKHISQLLNDIETIEQENTVLREKLSGVRDELAEATHHLTELTVELTSVKHTCKELEEKLNTVEEQNSALRTQMKELVEQKLNRDNLLDNFSEALNSRVDEWKRILEEKEAQVEELQERLLLLSAQAPNIQLDTERSRVTLLMQTLQQREEHIEKLKEQLVTATKDLSESAAIIEKFGAQKSRKNQVIVPDDPELMTVSKLQLELQSYKEKVKLLEGKMRDCEEDSQAKAKELSNIVIKLREYEAGEYGLSEAVNEINAMKKQIQIRDQQIEELVQTSNTLQAETLNIKDQNVALREKLGLSADSPVTTVTVTSQRKKDQLLLRVLQQQSERLEEEKLHLQLENRKLNKKLVKFLQKFDDLGYKSINELDITNVSPLHSPQRILKTAIDGSGDASSFLKAEDFQDEAESKSYITQEKKKLEESCSYLEEQLLILKKENEALRNGMHEILESIRNQDGSSDVRVESKCLERLLEALDSRHISGWYHPAMRLQAQLQSLEGSNAILRDQLRDARTEENKKKQELQNTLFKLEHLQEKLKTLEEGKNAGRSDSIIFQEIGIPVNISMSSAEIISRLNIHLLHVLNEYHEEEENNKILQSKVEDFEKKFNVIRHQMGLLYKEYNTDKENWQKKENSFIAHKAEWKEQTEGLQARLREMEVALNATKRTENKQIKTILESCSKLAVLSEENARYKRKYRTLESWGKQLCKENGKMKQEMCEMECAVTARIGELCRHKDMLFFQNSNIQKQLEHSVPVTVLENANKEFNALTLKYRDLLLKEQSLVFESQLPVRLQAEMDVLKKDKEELQNILQETKGRLHSLEVIVTSLNQDTVTQDTYDNEVSLLSKKLATLEVKELNERQRANHAEKMYTILKEQINHLEERNSELESKITVLTKENLSLQEVERELRDNLLVFVSREELMQAQQKLVEQESIIVELKIEKERLQEMADISQEQVRTLELWKVSQQFELDFLKKEIIELQSSSDDKAVIGRLSHDILSSRLSETAALKRVHDLNHRLLKLQAHNLQLESRLEEREKNISQIISHMNNRFRSSYEALNSLRRRYCGATLLSSQEQFSLSLRRLMEERKVLIEKVQTLESNVHNNSYQREEIQIQVETLKQLKTELFALQPSTHYQKQLIELQNRNMEFKLKESKSRRKAEMLELQLIHMRQTSQAQEEHIATLEFEQIKLEKDLQNIKFLWEQAYVELPNWLTKTVIVEKEKEKEVLSPLKPKTQKKPLKSESSETEEQLKQALSLISSQSQNIMKYENELAHLKSKYEVVAKDVEDKENLLASRNKIISELRAHLNDKSEIKSTGAEQPSNKDFQNKLAVEVTLETLQNTVLQKDESIARYQRLLKDSREDYNKLSAQYHKEVNELQAELTKKKEAYNILKKEMQVSLPRSQQAEIEQYVRRLKEMEDEVSELHITVKTLNGQLISSQEETDKWHHIAEKLQRNMDESKIRVEDEYRVILSARSEENKKLQDELKTLKEQLKEEISDKDKASLRSMVSTLRARLYDKDTKLKLQSDKISELQAKLKTSFERRHGSSSSISRLVDNKDDSAEDLNNSIEQYKLKITSLKNELENAKEKISSLQQLNNRLKPPKKDHFEEKLSAKEQELLNKITSLEDKLQAKELIEKEMIEAEMRKIKSAEEIARWDGRKQSQQLLEKTQQNLRRKTLELERKEKNVSSLKETISRLEREKNVLNSRLKAVKDTGSPEIRKLELEKAKLQSEVNELKKKLEIQQHHSGGLGATLLQEKLEEQQRRITVLELSKKGNTEVAEELMNLKESNAILRKANLRLESENLELQLDIERMRSDMPRLQEQVQHLEKYISLLKAEKSYKKIDPSKEPEASGVSKVSTKQSCAEMEKTIVVMKRVMEKLQEENKRLKENRGLEQSKRQDSTRKLKTELQTVMDEKKNIQEQMLEITQMNKEMETELEKYHMHIKLLEDRLNKSEGAMSDHAAVVNELSSVKTQLTHKSNLLDRVKTLLERAAIKEKTLLEQVRLLQGLVPENVS